MEPSSLVLVAALGVWAAFLVPAWLRRREVLAGARTTDRFSTGLRVLERRRPRSSSRRPSGDAVLSSPRMVVDSDGEMLYLPATRPVAQAPAPAAVPSPDAASPDIEESAAVDTAPDTDSARAAGQRVARRLLRESTSAVAAAAASPARQRPLLAPSSRADAGADRTGSSAGSPAGVDRPREFAVALMAAQAAARRRAAILAVLFVVTVSSWGVTSATGVPTWVGVPATVLLVAHLMASRVAGIRSREALAVLAAQARPVAVAPVRRPVARPAASAAPPAAAPAAEPEVAAERPRRLARRAAAVGETWSPVPVPAPTYTLKPAVPRPEPAPLDLPATFPAPPASPAASAFARKGPQRGSLPRRAEDIEQILDLDPVVNG